MSFAKLCNRFGMVIVILAISLSSAFAYRTQHVIVVLIDGVRYSESLGDTTESYCPHFFALSHQGAVQDSAFNDSITVTAFGIPATWMGRFYPLQDTSYNGDNIQFCRYPTSWEYARHDLSLPENQAIYVTPDYGTSTWMPSFYQGYGPNYWPEFIQPIPGDDNNQADFDSSVVALRRSHPKLAYIYLPDTDHAGHSGVWVDYVAKIRQADSLTNELWNVIQSDSVMHDRTTLIVTNDHGRHDDAHGGFQSHGDNCMGCRHVMMLAIGPDIAHGIHVNTPRASIRDIARTAGELLGFSTPFSPGRVMSELFLPPCEYIPGDINNNGEPDGVDVVYLVNYLKGRNDASYICNIGEGPFYVAADVNGDCDVNAVDVTYLVRYLKGGPEILNCPDYPQGQ